jgi:hypothetical protein
MTHYADFNHHDLRPGGWGVIGMFAAVVGTALMCVASTLANAVR